MSDGNIRNLEYWKSSQWLTHESWMLPRGCRPSDGGDMAIDSTGEVLRIPMKIDNFATAIMLFEFKNDARIKNWPAMNIHNPGQWRSYASQVIIGKGAIYACLCNHGDIPANRPMDTLRDIQTFSIMSYDATNKISKVKYSPLLRGDCLHEIVTALIFKGEK